MGIKISDLLVELSGYRMEQLSGSGAVELNCPAVTPAGKWEPETLYILDKDASLPETPPVGTACLILMGRRQLPEGYASDGSNILVCPDEKAKDALMTDLRRFFSDELAVSGAISQIYEAFLRKRTPQAVMDAANQALELPMVMADYTHTIIAHTCPPEVYGEADWDGFIAHGVIPEFMGESPSRILRNLCDTPAGPLRLTQNPDTGSYNLIGDMLYDGERIGRFAMGLPRGVPTRREMRILAVTAEVFASLIGSSPQTGFARGDVMEAFLSMLVEGGPAAENFFISQDTSPHYPHEGLFRVMVMDLEAHRPFRQPIRSVISYLEMICPGSISAVYGKNLVMLTNYQTRRTFEQRSEDELDGFIKEYLMYCGASREFTNIRDFARAYSDALAALEISRYLCRPSPDGLSYSLAEFDACESMIDANNLYKAGEDLLRRCHPYVLRLREYDGEYGSAYFDTLRAYLKYAQKTQLTAEKLCLHRNSLEYRLRKIKALTGLDWNDGDLMMRLMRSFVYLDFLDLAEDRARLLREISPSG